MPWDFDVNRDNNIRDEYRMHITWKIEFAIYFYDLWIRDKL